MDKRILEEYIDACEVIKEAEAEIRKLESKKSITANETVSGSNPEFPYNPQHFKVHLHTLGMGITVCKCWRLLSSR